MSTQNTSQNIAFFVCLECGLKGDCTFCRGYEMDFAFLYYYRNQGACFTRTFGVLVRRAIFESNTVRDLYTLYGYMLKNRDQLYLVPPRLGAAIREKLRDFENHDSFSQKKAWTFLHGIYNLEKIVKLQRLYRSR